MKIICFFLSIIIILLLIWPNKKEEVPIQQFISINEPEEKPNKNNELIAQIEEIYSKNKVENISFDNASINLKQIGRISAKIYFSNPKNFRMIISKDIDIGMNENHFWFWSKHMRNSALFYAKHENLMSSGLKMAFNPVWIVESLNFSPPNKIENVVKYKNKLGLVEKIIGTNGREAYKLTLFENDRISGHYLYDENLSALASTEIEEYQLYNNKLIPNKITIIWHEENITMKLTLNNFSTNNINNFNFQMPNKTPKIELGIKSSPNVSK